MSGNADGFMADAFHQIAVGGQHIGKMVDKVVAKARIHHAFGQRHAHGCGNALPKRAGCGFNACCMTIFWMPGCARPQLAEILNFLDCHVLEAQQVMQRILQHRTMTGRKNKPVAVGPIGCQRVDFQKFRIQNRRYVGGPHRQPRMAGFCRLNSIHGQGANGICHRAQGRGFCFFADIPIIGRFAGSCHDCDPQTFKRRRFAGQLNSAPHNGCLQPLSQCPILWQKSPNKTPFCAMQPCSTVDAISTQRLCCG